ncbi:prealbumin-like fold domain-containing protein [Nafulsella turpanensis]|uniref:prealbumin-like fold domain-containing protein n=1 Tax=Nafulsella turpanensis TaxID=1265690 RepID=UPI0003755865|nr:prealbumin-like fold domain-containing protein [Nafulsella turpanensis]
MKQHYTSLLCLFALSLFLFSSSCSPEDEPKPEPVTGTSMEFTILNNDGNPVEGALVKLYDSEENYLQESESALAGSGTSDENGKVKLSGLDPKTYYFSVTYGTSTFLTNWDGIVTTEEPLEELKINTLSVVIKESVLGYIAGYQKSWILDKIYVGEQDYTHQLPACSRDGLMTFTKSFLHHHDEGATKCESTDPQEKSGHFSINGNSITTVYEDGDDVIINILSMGKDKLEINGPDLHPDARLIFKAVYTQ